MSTFSCRTRSTTTHLYRIWVFGHNLADSHYNVCMQSFPPLLVLRASSGTIVRTLVGLMDAGRKPSNAWARAAVQKMVLLFGQMVIDARAAGREDIWHWAAELMEDFGRQRTARWQAELGVDCTDMAQMVQIQDIEDYVFGVTGHWVERDAGCAIKHETECPFAELAEQDPRLCSDLVHRFEVASYRHLNDTYILERLDDGPLLSRGDDHCRFVHRIHTHRSD